MPEELYLPQIAWFNATIARRRKQFGGAIVPALVFVHIPMAEFATASSAKSHCFGDHVDGITPTVANHGLFAALEAAPEIEAVFVGHDHCNDFCCQWGARAIDLCFGRHSGAGGYQCTGYQYGARVITVSLSNSSRSDSSVHASGASGKGNEGNGEGEGNGGPLRIDTHVRLMNGTIINRGTLK